MVYNIYNPRVINGIRCVYKTSKKEQAFEYLVIQLCDWWKRENPTKDFDTDNNLSVLKVMKLLFFVVAASANRDNNGLLDVFNNWEAQPYGHIETDIQQLIQYRKGNFKNFKINQNKIQLWNTLKK